MPVLALVSNVLGFYPLKSFRILNSFFDCELANAVQGITKFPSSFCKTFTQFEAYYIMSDMNWYDCIKSHHKGLGQVKTSFKMGKKNRKRNGKEKLKEKYRIEHELTGLF